MANGDIDLCVQYKGDWSIEAIYPSSQREKAMKDAKRLAEDKVYDAVMLIIDDTRQVLFSYTQKGPTPTYGAVVKGLKTSSGKKPSKINPAALRSLKEHHEKKEAETTDMPQVAFSTALMVGIGGMALTIIVAGLMGINGASLPTILMILMMLGSITIAVAMWVHSVFDEVGPATTEAQKQLDQQKKLKKTEQIFAEAYTTGKSVAWDEDADQFKADGHFGLILYMLGMSNGFHQALHTDMQATNRQIASLLSGAKIAPESIYNCANNLHEYLAYPRYNAMYNAGKESVFELVKETATSLNIGEALQQWFGEAEAQAAAAAAATTEEGAEQPRTVPTTNFAVVGFTDIVNFTESVRTMGDDWMVDVLQAHNSIVREAIESFGGYEVKHTGDGIMMSFPSVQKGLKACVSIQKGIKLFNEKMPERNFALRIGISAGEPIHMEGDLFGQPVNLAARIMPFAQNDQIAVSDSLHEMAADMHYTYTEKDDCILKGFEGPQTIYFLQWDDAPTPDPSESEEPQEPETLQE